MNLIPSPARPIAKVRLIGFSCLLAIATLLAVLWTAPVRAMDLQSALSAAMEGTKTPAMAVLVMRDGKVARSAVRGERRNDRPDPAGPNDVWLIASDAKPMTAALISKLVERHVLSWDAPLAKMLPALAASMRPEYRKVTLVELLSHRSGLPHDVSDLDYFSSFANDKDPLPKQRFEYISRALTEEPVVPPGTTLSYSNTGFIVAAVIAEKATGESYEDLIREEIFGPLGMKSPGFGRTPAGEPTGHHDGKPETASDGNPLMFAPAGNIYMSMADWARFCLDQMSGYHGHGKLLTKAGYRMMETLLPGGQSGMDWGVRPTFAGLRGPVLQHAGSDTNWFALALLFPESENGVLVAANAADDMGADKAALRLVHMIAPSLAAPAEQASSPAALPRP